MFFFFFKQKTAYEMRISDWSSDVCSSDLPWRASRSARRWLACAPTTPPARPATSALTTCCGSSTRPPPAESQHPMSGRGVVSVEEVTGGKAMVRFVELPQALHRSEEHTSELQSLMRISYAVFCLKK